MATSHPTGIDANQAIEDSENQITVDPRELAEIEDEIITLETVLKSKKKRAAELRAMLNNGGVWKEVTEGLNHGIKTVKDSTVFQKTSAIFGGITGNISGTLGQMRHSDSFRSFEEKVGNVYDNVKTKVVSRSNSQQNLDDTNRSRTGSIVTSPTIAEEKPFP